jgi:metallopeptidase YgjP-like protein
MYCNVLHRRVSSKIFKAGLNNKKGAEADLSPARRLEYVVVHELTHLHEPHHTPQFWNRVERVMPDYERRKSWLAKKGIEVEGIV